jgi:hypothetical protein
MTSRKLFNNFDYAQPGLPAREVWRQYVASGRIILFETMEEVFIESRDPKVEDRNEIFPIYRAVWERTADVIVFPKKWTIVLEGLSETNLPPETVELFVDDNVTDLGNSIGHRFRRHVKNVRIVRFSSEPSS